MTDIRRTLLWSVFLMSLFLLYDAWNKHNGQPSLFAPSTARPAARYLLVQDISSIPIRFAVTA